MKSNKYRSKLRIWMTILCCAGMLLLMGCVNSAKESDVPAQTKEQQSFITCFGTVKWRDSHMLSFPFDITIKEIGARSGQLLKAQDVLFNVDYDELTRQKTESNSKLESLKLMKRSYENELASVSGSLSEKLSDLNKRIEGLKVAAPFSGKVLNVNIKEGDILSAGQKLGVLVDDTKMRLRLYFSYAYDNEIKKGMKAEIAIPSVMSSVTATVENVKKIRKISPDGAVLFEVCFIMDNPGALTKDMVANATILSTSGEKMVSSETGMLEYYREMDITVKENGTVVDLPMQNFYEFSEGATLLVLENYDYDLQVSKLKDQLEKVKLNVEGLNSGYSFEGQAQMNAKAAMLKDINIDILQAKEKADMINYILSCQAYKNIVLKENGMISTTDGGFLIDRIYAAANAVIAANEPIMSLAHMDSLEVSCFVEEQLAKDIHIGDKAQLALYSDSTAIELGSVAFISQKAVLVNGETVVEVIIEYEGDNFLPEYNVVAKITPRKSN